MLDGVMRRIIDPSLGKLGEALARRGIGADQVTLVGFVLGMACSAAIVLRFDMLALALLAAGRMADGLDGAVARASRMTDRGGFLDITCDFALREPALCAMPSAVLLAAFYANGASFLAFSAIAARRGMQTRTRGVKSLYFTTGLMEGTETIAFFAAFILFPGAFAPLAYLFAALCGLTCAARILLAWRVFGVDDAAN
jgi:phosphatidylglycerophosphate synthase